MMGTPLAVLSALRLDRPSEKEILQRLALAGAEIEPLDLDGEKDALAIGFNPGSAGVPSSGLVDLRRLRYLRLSGVQVTDASLNAIGTLPNLKSLVLAGTALTDAGLKMLRGCTGLAFLSLQGTGVTDAGLERLPDLCVLNLAHCPGITDAGVDALARLHRLEWLDLRGTRVTAAGVARLRKELPGCTLCT